MGILMKTQAENSHFIHHSVLNALPVFIRNTHAISAHATESWASDKSKSGRSAQCKGIGEKNKCI